jgi:hypothetical protein
MLAYAAGTVAFSADVLINPRIFCPGSAGQLGGAVDDLGVLGLDPGR